MTTNDKSAKSENRPVYLFTRLAIQIKSMYYFKQFTLLTLLLLSECYVFAGAITNWGPEMKGVRMSIASSNTVLTIGSNLLFSACITNASTNVISVFINSGIEDFEVSLIDGGGNEVSLTPKPPVETIISMRTHEIPPQGHFETLAQIKVLEVVRPGRYKLQARRGFLVLDQAKPKGSKLESNVLDVEVRK